MDFFIMVSKLYFGEYVLVKDVEWDFDLIVKNVKVFNGDDYFVIIVGYKL